MSKKKTKKVKRITATYSKEGAIEFATIIAKAFSKKYKPTTKSTKDMGKAVCNAIVGVELFKYNLKKTIEKKLGGSFSD